MILTNTDAMSPAEWTTYALSTMDRLMDRVAAAVRYATETDRILATFDR